MTYTAILIPAYNEEPRIEAVLQVVCSLDDARVVVIDDGSNDATATKAAKFPVDVLRYRKNRGKGAALELGIMHVGVGQVNSWVFLDADLINLQPHHIRNLLEPLKANNVGMSIGRFVAGTKFVDWAQRFFSILNGQRALSDDFVRTLPGLSWSRFGVEVLLSRFAKLSDVCVKEPLLEELTHYTKEQKMGTMPGIWDRIKMYGECLSAVKRWENHLDDPALDIGKETYRIIKGSRT